MDDAHSAAILAYVTRDATFAELYFVRARLMAFKEEFYKPGRNANWKTL